MEYITIIGIAICLFFSGLFSGLNLGYFGISRLKLEIESESGNKNALKILNLRRDSHFLLTTLLWGNVSVNCLLTLLSESILTGFIAFTFSTFGITLFGEIIPQAYLTRNAFKIGAFFAPLIRFIQIILYPVAKPSAKLLDYWLGKEGLALFRESELKIMLEKHIFSQKSDISRLEGLGAINFLALDDVKICDEGEIINPESIITLALKNGRPLFPFIKRSPTDPFLQQVQESGKKWIILINESGNPELVLNADAFLRDALYEPAPFQPYHYCHRPIIIKSKDTKLGEVILQLKVHPEHSEDDVIDHDIIIFWGEQKRIITGADIFGRLLRGIVKREKQKSLIK